MRVAILTDFFGGLGGTEVLSARAAAGLHARGHDVRVLCPRSPTDRTWVRHLRSIGMPVVVGAPERRFPDANGAQHRTSRERLLDWVTARVAGAAFRSWTPDVILANPMGPLLVTWLRWHRRPRIPVVGYEFSAADSRCAHWYPPEFPRLVNRLDAVIAGCEASRRGVINYHGFTGPTAVVPPLVPPASAQPLPAQPWRLACIARLCVEKGLDYLLAALPELRQRLPRVSLDLYGEGYDRNRVADLSRALQVEDIVTVAGRFDPTSGLDRLVARHAIFVQPSLYESIPTALLEVAARGRLVVASRVGGIPEFFAAGGQGALVRPAYPGDIADAVTSLLAEPEQLDQRGRRNAAVVAQHYAQSAGLDTLEATLHTVAAEVTR